MKRPKVHIDVITPYIFNSFVTVDNKQNHLVPEVEIRVHTKMTSPGYLIVSSLVSMCSPLMTDHGA